MHNIGRGGYVFKGVDWRHIYLYIHTISLEVEANKLGCQLPSREGRGEREGRKRREGREQVGQGTGVGKSLLYFILYLLNSESYTCII